jgi:hypothetical protein
MKCIEFKSAHGRYIRREIERVYVVRTAAVSQYALKEITPLKEPRVLSREFIKEPIETVLRRPNEMPDLRN